MIFYKTKLKDPKDEDVETFLTLNSMCELSFDDNDKNLLKGDENGTEVEYERIK
jgi:hypothetical protein